MRWTTCREPDRCIQADQGFRNRNVTEIEHVACVISRSRTGGPSARYYNFSIIRYWVIPDNDYFYFEWRLLYWTTNFSMTTMFILRTARVGGPTPRTTVCCSYHKWYHRRNNKWKIKSMNIDWARICKLAGFQPNPIPSSCLSSPVPAFLQKQLPKSSSLIKSGSVSTQYIINVYRRIAHYQTTEMDPKMANIPFFSLENVSQWVVLEQWHEYQLDIRRQLNTSDSYRSCHFGCLNSCRCLWYYLYTCSFSERCHTGARRCGH